MTGVVGDTIKGYGRKGLSPGNVNDKRTGPFEKDCTDVPSEEEKQVERRGEGSLRRVMVG